MKKIICLCLCLCLLGATACKKQTDLPQLSTQKASDDFSDLFKTADAGGDALAVVKIDKVSEVRDIVEYYAVSDTRYTKIEATLERSFSEQLVAGKITIYILGSKANFPAREELIKERSYLLRLKSWVHQDGPIWLVSPLESAYLRVFENEVLVHESAHDLNYQKALSVDAFAEKYKEYHAEHPLKQEALTKHFTQMIKTLQSYDYQNKELEYTLDEKAIKARLDLAENLKSRYRVA